MPLYIKIPELDALVVHAGVKPYLPIERQSREDLCYLRYTDKNGKFVSIRKIHELGSVEAAGGIYWTEKGPFQCAKTIVYGHNVWDDIKIDMFPDGSKCVGIDLGVCFGGELCGYVLQTGETIKVKAKQVYYEPGYKIQ